MGRQDIRHGKGTIDAMSSFGVKSIVRKDIVAQDVFFSNSFEICEYLKSKKTNVDFVYRHIPDSQLAARRSVQSHQENDVNWTKIGIPYGDRDVVYQQLIM